MRMRKMAELVLISLMAMIGAHGQSIGVQLASGGETLILDGHEAINDDVSIAHNLTMSGINNATLDGSNRIYQLEIGDRSEHRQVTLRDILFVDFPRIYSNGDLTLERCHFINSSFSAGNGIIVAKDCVFEQSKTNRCGRDGGGLTLYNIVGCMTNCSFLGNEAYQNTSSCNGGTGGGLVVSNSEIILDDPVIEGNMAAWGGGIAVSNSTLRINGGKIKNNLANPINYTDPVSYFGGVGGAIDVVNSKVTLSNTIISGNRARVAPIINSTKDSEVKLVGDVVISDNREIRLP